VSTVDSQLKKKNDKKERKENPGDNDEKVFGN
jgi:hypothetical protein